MEMEIDGDTRPTDQAQDDSKEADSIWILP